MPASLLVLGAGLFATSEARTNISLTMYPDGNYPEYEEPTGDESVGEAIGILVIIGAVSYFLVSIFLFVRGFKKGIYGNPKPRKKPPVRKTKEELEEETAAMFEEDNPLSSPRSRSASQA